MARHYPDIWVVTRHQYEITSAFASQTSFGWKTSGDVAKCRLFLRLMHDRTGKSVERTFIYYLFLIYSQ